MSGEARGEVRGEESTEVRTVISVFVDCQDMAQEGEGSECREEGMSSNSVGREGRCWIGVASSGEKELPPRKSESKNCE